MTDTAAKQLKRILQVLPEIADGKEHKLSVVSRRVGLPKDVLLADLKSLADHQEAPGESPPGQSFRGEHKSAGHYDGNSRQRCCKAVYRRDTGRTKPHDNEASRHHGGDDRPLSRQQLRWMNGKGSRATAREVPVRSRCPSGALSPLSRCSRREHFRLWRGRPFLKGFVGKGVHGTIWGKAFLKSVNCHEPIKRKMPQNGVIAG